VIVNLADKLSITHTLTQKLLVININTSYKFGLYYFENTLSFPFLVGIFSRDENEFKIGIFVGLVE
jgi:hypothetical protein